jgi:rhamnosyltransferase
MIEMSIPISVVMRSYNDAALLPRTLAALDAQEGVEIDLIVMESASTDNSVALFEQHGFAEMHHIAPGAYTSSLVLNRGVFLAQHELVAFVNSDAVLTDPRSLRRLVDALMDDEQVAGVFGRQVVRPDADVMTRLDYFTAFEHREWMGNMESSMSLVVSMLRKSVWQEIPFDERLTYAEDAVWTQAVQQAGYRTQYVKDAVAEHSHDYTWKERYRRSYGDAAAMAVMLNKKPASNLIFGALMPFVRRVLVDTSRLVKMGRPLAIFLLPIHRWPEALGAHDGMLAGWQHFHIEKSDELQPKC